ncbi:hypothetical protein EW145_g808 [Phellinidium pouzarii]|uniref:Pal1 cell morphology protein n=1 Tax=Phellinidium pouzarii TaxID=167371 RepID=A0A4S4LGY4_9AGAM|nr:hypothetical protein EW145_g808 [Phellinidium pouzarii]
MQSSANVHRQPFSIRPAHPRARSSSDPFGDPVYQAPQLSYDNPPQPPLKQAKKSTRVYNDHRDPRMLESAVRDAVSVRPVDQSPRNRMGRSQTGGVQAATPRHAPPSSRRSYSQDSVNVTQTVTASTGDKTRKSGKKGSSHADVIDRLDFTGNGPMFHHDGPFDACAPSRNRHKAKAPMFAWTSPEDEGPTSAAQFRSDRRLAAVDYMRGGYSDSPYPNVVHHDADIYSKPKNPKQVDRIAEAWGIHEPEPYEEFFGGGGANGDVSTASSIRGGYEGHPQNGRGRARDGRELRELNTYEGRPPPARRQLARNLPPPQPIDLPGAGRTTSLDAAPGSLPSPGPPSSPGAPKRSKSLMQKIRKMRDAPNVPVDAGQNGDDSSPSSSIENYTSSGYPSPTDGGRQGRPAHRHQNSFFNRFGRNTSANAGQISPTDSNEHYVYVEKSVSTNKALPPRPAETPANSATPATPPNLEKDGYFDGPVSPNGTSYTPGGGVSRKTSLLKKVKGVVRGAGNK